MKNNFYLFYSEDKSLINKEIANLKSKLTIDDNDVINYNIDNITDIVEEASIISMFSKKKFIIIDATNYLSLKKNIDNINLLEDYFGRYNSDSYLIFISYNSDVDSRKKLCKLISSNGTIKRLESNNEYIKDYISNYLKENNFSMDNLSLSLFMSRCGNNIDNVTNELDKLILYKYNEKIINKDDIIKITEDNIDDNIYNLVNCILKNDKKKAMDLYNKFVIDGMDSSQIIAVISSQIRLLFQVKRLYNKGKTNDEIAKILEFKSVYRVKYLLGDSYYYSEDMLCKYLYKLAIIDRKIKYGTADGKVLLELFIAEKDM